MPSESIIFENVSFWTPEGTWIEHGIIIVEDGAIKTIDTDYRKENYDSAHDSEATRLRCNNNTVLPGMCDSHVHFLETGLLALQTDLSSAESLDNLFQLLLDHNSDSETRWLRGYRLIPENLKERRMPTAEELDRIFPDKPVFITRIDGHSSVINRAAARMVEKDGFPVTEKDLQKPILGTRHYNLFHWLNSKIQKDEKKEAYRKAALEAASKGLTLVHGLIGNSGPDCEDAEILIEVLPSLVIDVIPWFQTTRVEKVTKLGLDRIGGCLMIDGSMSSRTAALSREYTDDPANMGLLYFSDEFLDTFLRKAIDNNLQVAFHAIGDRAIDQLISAYSRAGAEPELRWRVEHGILPTSHHIREGARMGLIFSVQPAFEAYAGGPDGLYRNRIGSWWKKTHPFRTLIDSGILLAGGSDSTVTPMDPLSGIHHAINHPNPEHRVKPLEALEMFTINGAFAGFMENETGSLSQGKNADIVLLTEKLNPNNPDFSSASIDLVLKKGKSVHGEIEKLQTG